MHRVKQSEIASHSTEHKSPVESIEIGSPHFSIYLYANGERTLLDVSIFITIEAFIRRVSQCTRIPLQEVYLLKEGSPIIPHNSSSDEQFVILNRMLKDYLTLLDLTYGCVFVVEKKDPYFFLNNVPSIDSLKEFIEVYTYCPQDDNYIIIYSLYSDNMFGVENFTNSTEIIATTDCDKALLATIFYSLYQKCVICKIDLMRKRDFSQLDFKPHEGLLTKYYSKTPIEYVNLYTLAVDAIGSLSLKPCFSIFPTIEIMQKTHHFQEIGRLILKKYKEAQCKILKLNLPQYDLKINYHTMAEEICLLAINNFYPSIECELTEIRLYNIIRLLSSLTLLLAIIHEEPERLDRPAQTKDNEDTVDNVFLHFDDIRFKLLKKTSVGHLLEPFGLLSTWILLLNELNPEFFGMDENPGAIRRKNFEFLIKEIHRAYHFLTYHNSNLCVKFREILTSDLFMMELPTEESFQKLVLLPTTQPPKRKLTNYDLTKIITIDSVRRDFPYIKNNLRAILSLDVFFKKLGVIKDICPCQVYQNSFFKSLLETTKNVKVLFSEEIIQLVEKLMSYFKIWILFESTKPFLGSRVNQTLFSKNPTMSCLQLLNVLKKCNQYDVFDSIIQKIRSRIEDNFILIFSYFFSELSSLLKEKKFQFYHLLNFEFFTSNPYEEIACLIEDLCAAIKAETQDKERIAFDLLKEKDYLFLYPIISGLIRLEFWKNASFLDLLIYKLKASEYLKTINPYLSHEEGIYIPYPEFTDANNFKPLVGINRNEENLFLMLIFKKFRIIEKNKMFKCSLLTGVLYEGHSISPFSQKTMLNLGFPIEHCVFPPKDGCFHTVYVCKTQALAEQARKQSSFMNPQVFFNSNKGALLAKEVSSPFSLKNNVG